MDDDDIITISLRCAGLLLCICVLFRQHWSKPDNSKVIRIFTCRIVLATHICIAVISISMLGVEKALPTSLRTSCLRETFDTITDPLYCSFVIVIVVTERVVAVRHCQFHHTYINRRAVLIGWAISSFIAVCLNGLTSEIYNNVKTFSCYNRAVTSSIVTTLCLLWIVTFCVVVFFLMLSLRIEGKDESNDEVQRREIARLKLISRQMMSAWCMSLAYFILFLPLNILNTQRMLAVESSHLQIQVIKCFAHFKSIVDPLICMVFEERTPYENCKKANMMVDAKSDGQSSGREMEMRPLTKGHRYSSENEGITTDCTPSRSMRRGLVDIEHEVVPFPQRYEKRLSSFGVSETTLTSSDRLSTSSESESQKPGHICATDTNHRKYSNMIETFTYLSADHLPGPDAAKQSDLPIENVFVEWGLKSTTRDTFLIPPIGKMVADETIGGETGINRDSLSQSSVAPLLQDRVRDRDSFRIKYNSDELGNRRAETILKTSRSMDRRYSTTSITIGKPRVKKISFSDIISVAPS